MKHNKNFIFISGNVIHLHDNQERKEPRLPIFMKMTS